MVIDNGCGTIKLGMAGEKKPSIVQPALYGVPKRYSLQMAGLDNKKDRQFGDAAATKAGVMQLGKLTAKYYYSRLHRKVKPVLKQSGSSSWSQSWFP